MHKKFIEHLKYVHKKRFHEKKVSRRTLFFMREYGPKSHVATVIIRQSLLVLLFATTLSLMGGIGLESAKQKITQVLPLLILIPALNDMIGDFGTIVSSKITTMLYLGHIKRNVLGEKEVRKMLSAVVLIALASAVYLGVASSALSMLMGFTLTTNVLLKIVLISLLMAFTLVTIIILISVFGSLIIYKRGDDPDNFLIPITTSAADAGSLVMLYFVVSALF
ncbi:MAG: magnesium transporter [Candidatus Aenigmatarchaeota archaeon]